jgi:hypothetical protein
MDKYEAYPYPTRPFWAGLDPDKPEPRDKVLAALHCYQVASPGHSSFYFVFTVDRKDHHRLADGFPELQKLAAAIHKEIPFVRLPFSTLHPIQVYLTNCLCFL